MSTDLVLLIIATVVCVVVAIINWQNLGDVMTRWFCRRQ